MAASGGGSGEDISSIPGWRTGLLFLLFAVISVSRRSKRRGRAQRPHAAAACMP